MICDEILGQRSENIGERVLDDFLHTFLRDPLRFDSSPYLKSFMSFLWMKDYTYIVIDHRKVPQVSSYIFYIS